MFRHTLYNLIGLGLPLVAAVLTIPLLIEALGVERFGMLALIWALVSYFGLFDLGLGRALTRELAGLRAQETFNSSPGMMSVRARPIHNFLRIFSSF